MRIVFALVGTCVALLAGVSCGGEDSGRSDAGSGSGEVSFLVFGDPEEIQAYRDLVTSFKE